MFFRCHWLSSWLRPVHTVHLLLKHIFNTARYIIKIQRAFRAHFMLRGNDAVPDWKSIMLLVSNFRVTGKVLKRKPPWRIGSARTSGWFKILEIVYKSVWNSGHLKEAVIFNTKLIQTIYVCLNKSEINILIAVILANLKCGMYFCRKLYDVATL